METQREENFKRELGDKALYVHVHLACSMGEISDRSPYFHPAHWRKACTYDTTKGELARKLIKIHAPSKISEGVITEQGLLLLGKL